MNKKDARNTGLKRRKELSEQEREYRSEVIFTRLKEMIDESQLVGCYVSINEEVDTKRIIEYCFEKRIRIAVPKTIERTLQFHEITSFDDLEEGNFHVPEPKRGDVIDVKDIDLMIVPLSAFDDENNRTGYGKGFYDSVLEQCSKKVGIAYKEQKIDHIDADPWDVKLDRIISA